MFDIWMRNTNLAAAVLIVSLVVILPGQLLLCFRVRSRRLRLMPGVILFLAAAANILLYLLVSGWKRMIFACGAVYILLMLFACGLGWTIWAIIQRGRDVL